MMDIPYPWNVMTGVGCLAALTGFFAWLHVTDRRLRARYRAWARSRGWVYDFRPDAAPPSAAPPFIGVFELRHRFTGDVGGRTVTVAEYRHDCPVRTATVVIATDVPGASAGFDVTGDRTEGDVPPVVREAVQEGHDPRFIHYRLESGRLMLLRRYETLNPSAAIDDATRLARIADILVVPIERD